MKAKQMLAWVLIFAMVVNFMPGFGYPVLAAEQPTVIQTDTKENTNQAGGIIYTKTSTAKSDGTVDITLTAHTTGEVKQLSSVTPTDIVLVLDVSGSMESAHHSYQKTTYEEVDGSRYYTSGMFGYGFNNQRSYYINTGTAEEPVYTTVIRTGRDDNGYDYYEYTKGTTEVYVYPELRGGTYTNRSNNYPVYQFYSADTTFVTQDRMTVLKEAVDSFIDTTATMNEGLAEKDMHTISIVKFAGERYSNNTTDKPVITEGNETYTYDDDTYNYSQVVKGLTVVDETGKAALKTAVAALKPAGSTAVEKGLALAEAVLMNRSAVIEDGAQAHAVDRNEVVIVFTDGEPNHYSGFDQDVANKAIEIAGRMKNTAGVTIYSVSVDPKADAADLDENINKFMHYVSSNYPSATSMIDDGTGGSIDKGYYMTPDSSTSLSMIFDAIIQNIDHPTIKLGEEATMVDTISPYFDFQGNVADVRLQTSARNADGTWADPVDDANLVANITGDRLTVDGFDFDANYVSETGRGDNKDFYGKRLVVTFTVVPDYDVIDVASAALIDGVIPTNTGLAILEDSASAPVAEVTTPKLTAHKVTYKIDGDEYTTYNRFVGSDITVDAVPTKAGYTFSGWNTEDAIITNGEFVMPDKDVVITGTFTANTYNVAYQYSTTPPTGAPSLPAAHTAQYGATVDVADQPVLAGYVFVGWYPMQTDVTVTEGKFTMPAKDVTLLGYFEGSTSTPYKVEHYLETLTDGEYEDAPEVTETFYGTTDNDVTATPLNRFTGFTYNAGVSTVSGKIAGDGSLVLKLYYDRNEYNVTYGYEGDIPANVPALPDGGTYKYGQSVSVGDDAVPPAGYTFTGWY